MTTEIELIGNTWPLVPFGDVVENFDSKRIPIKQADRKQKSGKYPYYGASGVIDYIDDYIFDGEYLLVAEDGANLLSRSTPIAFRASGKMWVNNHAHIVKFNGRADLRYLEYYLNSISLVAFVTGSAQPKLNRKKLDNIRIPIPPLKEQKRIAAILDKADTIRRKRKQTVCFAENLLESAFVGKFGAPDNSPYEVMELQSVTSKITDGAHHTPTYTDSGVPFLRVTDINKGDINWSSTKFIPSEEHDALIKRCKPEKGDVLYSKNGTIGVPKLINWDIDFSIFVSLCLIKPQKEKLLGKYLESFLKTSFALVQAKARSKSATVTNLHLVEIKEFKLPVPPLPIQQEWVDSAKKIEELITKYKAMYSMSDDTFNSIAQKVFQDELDLSIAV